MKCKEFHFSEKSKKWKRKKKITVHKLIVLRKYRYDKKQIK